MTSERAQRQIERLLDEAESAMPLGKWEVVRSRSEAVLALDPDNADARAYLKAAERGLARPAGSGSSAELRSGRLGAADSRATVPDSFAGGRYRVLKFLGEGGKKRVFLAHDELLDRDVAFALIKTEGLDEVGRERIVREAQAMGRLTHPHVVSIFDIGEEGGTPYVVTELMGGGDVEGLLESAAGPLSTEQSLRIAAEVCRGLVFAHERGVVHRDLKPGNVWLTAEGTAKIGDFGLAVSLDKSRLTQHGTMVGTVAYMPPEQALGSEVTPQADLYSLGVMLYEMVTGRLPFGGENQTAVISQHINTPPVAPSWHTEHCPADLEELILRLLEKEPGKRPASAQEVLEALGRIDPKQPGRRHSGSDANPLDRLARGVFVGRERELERLRAAFDDAFAGRGSVVMLVGEPGIGKTRTVQELETYARMRGAHVFWGRSHESSGMPAYWPWVQVGNAWGAAVDLTGTAGEALVSGAGSLQPGTSELVRLFPVLRELPGFVEPEPATEPEAAQFRLFDAYATFMRNESPRQPWLVVLDDLHWADKPTLQLLQFVARELANMRVLVVGTYRDTELARTHPLSEALAELNRAGGFLRVPLRGLTAGEVRTYIFERTGRRPSTSLSSRIYEETEGNPFFLSEVVNLMAEEGTLDRESGSDISLPEGVREALGRRLDRLSEDANGLLQLCAVVGREFTYDTLTLLGERRDDELLRLIEEALAPRVIEETETPGRYRFTHALMQETLLGELSTTRKVRLHGQVAEAIEKRYGTNADARPARLALHYSESATLTPAHAQKAARYSRLAGEQAEAQFGWDDAIRHYQNCLGLIEGAEDRLDEDEAAVLEALGRCQLYAQAFRPAWRSLLRAMDIYRSRGDWSGSARTTVLVCDDWAPPERRLALVDAALEMPGDREPRLEAMLLIERVGNRRVPEEQRDADLTRARGLAEAGNHSEVLAALIQTSARRQNIAGKLEEAAELYREAATRYDAVGNQFQCSTCLFHAGRLATCLARLTEAEDLLEEALQYARRWRVGFNEQNSIWGLAVVALLRGDLSRARSLVGDMDQSATYLPQTAGGWISLLTGDWKQFEELLPDPAMAGSVPLYRAQLHGARARTFYFIGDIARAEDEIRAVEDLLSEEDLNVAAGAGPAFAALADIPIVRAAYERAKERPDFRLFASMSMDELRGLLALRLDLLDEAEQHFSAGVELSENESLPITLGQCLQGLAEVSERRNEHDQAMQYLDRAADLFKRYGAKLLLDQVLEKKELLKA